MHLSVVSNVRIKSIWTHFIRCHLLGGLDVLANFQLLDFLNNNNSHFLHTRIFGAYGPIMLALRVWVGFRARWRGGTLSKKSSFVSIPASCSEGHFLSIVFGRTHCIMFGRTLFEYCVQKDTLPYVQKDTFQNTYDK